MGLTRNDFTKAFKDALGQVHRFLYEIKCLLQRGDSCENPQYVQLCSSTSGETTVLSSDCFECPGGDQYNRVLLRIVNGNVVTYETIYTDGTGVIPGPLCPDAIPCPTGQGSSADFECQSYCLKDTSNNTVYKIVCEDYTIDNIDYEKVYYTDAYGNKITPDEAQLIPCSSCYQVVFCMSDTNTIKYADLVNGKRINFDSIFGVNTATIQEFADYMINIYGGTYNISYNTDTPHFSSCGPGEVEIQFIDMSAFIEEVTSFDGVDEQTSPVDYYGDCTSDLALNRIPGEIGDEVNCTEIGTVGLINDWKLIKIPKK